LNVPAKARGAEAETNAFRGCQQLDSHPLEASSVPEPTLQQPAMPSDTSTQPISEPASPPTSNAGTALNSSPDQAPVRLMLRTGNGDAPVSVHRGNTNEPVLIKLVVSNASQRIDEVCGLFSSVSCLGFRI